METNRTRTLSAKMEIGTSYRLNGLSYTVVADLAVGQNLSKRLSQIVTVLGKRGAVKNVEVRHNGTAYFVCFGSYNGQEILFG